MGDKTNKTEYYYYTLRYTKQNNKRIVSNDNAIRNCSVNVGVRG